MTHAEIKMNLNNMRATLKLEEAKLVESLNRVMGCEMLCEKMMNEIENEPEIKLEEVPAHEDHPAG